MSILKQVVCIVTTELYEVNATSWNGTPRMVQAGKIDLPWGALLTMERYGESEIRFHAFLTWSVSRPAAFLLGKCPRYLLERRLGRPHSRPGLCGEQKNLPPLPGIKTVSSAIQPVALYCTD
jgi:hypothetical protein